MSDHTAEASREADEKVLPSPDSRELTELLPSSSHVDIYRYLYLHREAPPTMQEIREHIAELTGKPAPAQTDRRVRDLRAYFDIKAEGRGNHFRYALRGWRRDRLSSLRNQVSDRVRAQVLAPQRCIMCGKTPRDHGVLLEVDHKLPYNWGGSDDIQNLQPLCRQCNAGKRDWYATYDHYAEEIRQAAQYEEPHRRIGELLKAFHSDWVPSDLIEVVASLRQYQDDWQKRLRELRTLGWRIPVKKAKDPQLGRFVTWYRAESWVEWPSGPIRAEITRLEKEARIRKNAAS